MRITFWAVCTILSVLPACQWREDCKDEDGIAQLKVDPQFSSWEQAAIQRASWRWNDFARHIVIEVEPQSYGLWSCTIIATDKEVVHGTNAQGVTRHVTGNIEMASTWNCSGERRARGVPCLEAIMMHEMGHLLGLGHHSAGVDGVMRGTGGASLDFTEGDRRACEAIDVCR